MSTSTKRPSLLYSLLNAVWRASHPSVSTHSHTGFPFRPPRDDRDAWCAYWKTQGQPWRTEPEIDEKRQEYLAQRRTILPDIQQGFYPFKGMKLNRADVEWILATHENGRGPVDWSEEHQRRRHGLDLRGADVCQVDLRKLPLVMNDNISSRYRILKVPKRQGESRHV